MKTKKRHISARERRERSRRMMSLTHVLIAIVALVECLLLVSFTTYSWIESSSSLIISSGEKGEVKLSIAENLNYKVALGFDSGGNVRLDRVVNDNNEETEHGFYRTVQNFSYAMTSSYDGEHFFFPKTTKTSSGEGSSTIYSFSSGTSAYRAGDTADYNTAYTYIDFNLTNSTLSNKTFYFANDEIFSVGDATTEISNIIKSAMRISVSKKNMTSGTVTGPIVFSLDGDSDGGVPRVTSAISDVNGTTANVDTKKIADSIFVNRDDEGSRPVFESDYQTEVNRDAEGNVVDHISIRIWFESQDPVYLAATSANAETKAAVDSAIYAAKVNVSFKMLFDNVDYDQIYFDDYTFSSKIFTDENSVRVAKHSTEENDSYRMFLHAYNSDEVQFVNYPMSKTESPEGAIRWVTSVPLDYVVDGYLESTETEEFSNTYFFYAPSSTAFDAISPSGIAYKWPLQSVMTLGGGSNENDPLYIASGDTTRAIGLVRDATTTGAGMTVTGYSMAEDANDPMTLVYLRDRTTGFTGSGYNMDTSSVKGAGYINSSVGTMTDGTPRVIYRYLVPNNATYMLFNKGELLGENQTGQITSDWIFDGKCYYIGHLKTSDGYDNKRWFLDDDNDNGVLPIELPKSNVEGYKAIYFYYYDAMCWMNGVDTPHLYYRLPSSTGNDQIGEAMEYYTTVTTSTSVANLYINNFGADHPATQIARAQQSISMYYDNTNAEKPYFMAYVPTSWLTASGTNMKFHFNRLGYYDDSRDTILFSSGQGSMTNGAYVYTALGYTDTAARNLLTVGTGVGTWDDVRLMQFDTELIDSNISSGYVYKIGYHNGTSYVDYPMVPSDGTGLTFSAYMPLSSSIRFTRYAALGAAEPNGYWYPQTAAADSDTVFYAVDSVASTDADSAVRGWYHVAVLVDATYENLIYDTVLGTDAAQSASLSFSTNYSSDGTGYTTIAANTSTPVNSYLMNGGTDTYTRRWVVPCGVDDTVYFRWTPYPATSTVFEYSIDTYANIYLVVTEAPAAVQAEAEETPEPEPEP